MTNEEFSNEFDTLVSSNSRITSFGIASDILSFDEYEKSIFLTEAQESIVVSLYDGTFTGESFEKTEKLRRFLNELVKNYSIESEEIEEGLTPESHFFNLPEDVWFITYESISSENSTDPIEVIPITQDEFHRVRKNPFRGANKRRALRLEAGNAIVEIIFPNTITKYQMRYLSKPDPIILIDLPKGLSINGETQQTECKLNPAIHRVILERAVSLALKSRANAGK